MTPRISAIVLAAVIALTGCENLEVPATSVEDGARFAQAPATGNGNKLVFPFDLTLAVSCGDEPVSLRLIGWVQVHLFDEGNSPNVELDVFHGVLTFTNSAGASFVWRDVGPDRYFLQDGELHLAISGRSTASGNLDREDTVIGHVVLNLTTGEVELVAGNAMGTIFAIACEALS